ncbi:hypothetical protein CONCODRAFT_11745 [Conidiobolus coronatus NRRL 28638]|uniref:Zn(2)-C6 fungal-type domain-containing protein n=1 Tax=Conidiobolus coronatus (strain ATCC 28846 / CBS 209.66 / NRRL 28638) TaxID=796925 RepID=A0A137NUL8_CONC2|nr:hypothetical protein CONCODRAFT_11745 [Conidiobolus coronatus NRRL 28638]|eukprot:KXN66418.1 hypothetical protein CONCODRAFT_11745 [Conidiobolus coronatus NRRL 28638]
MFSVFHKKVNTDTDGGIGKYSCKSCRLKKKKCDRILPKCSRCSQYNLNCEPFERNINYSKLSTAITKFNQDDNNKISLNSKEKAQYTYFNSMISGIVLSQFNRITGGCTVNFGSKNNPSLILELSNCIDVVVFRINGDEKNMCLAINNYDPTLLQSFWDNLLVVYFTEVHLFHSIICLNSFSLGSEYWIRTNIIYCLAYEYSSFKSPIATAKMNKLLLLSEYRLNLNPPSLLSVQCYLLLYDLHRAKGNSKKKDLCFHSAVKISHLIGLTNKLPGISTRSEYERYLCYVKLAETYWLNRFCSINNGLSLDKVDFWPKFSLNFQTLDNIYLTEDDLIVANNVSLNIRFRYEVFNYIIPPFVKLVESEKINLKTIAQLDLELDKIYNNIAKELVQGPFSSDTSSIISIYYLGIKLQLNTILVKQSNNDELQFKYIKLSHDIVRVYSDSNIKSAVYLITILAFLQTNDKLRDNFSIDNNGKLDDLVVIMRNLAKSPAFFKIPQI